MAVKSRDAFRTISEVADWLGVPTHVLRFWESRFSQIKPVKRAGGRRYYRPSDMRIIGGVKVLLHDQGMTIRGVQKQFREEGLKNVQSFSPDLFEDGDVIEGESASLDEETLEQASRPASAARSTRDASPDPIPDDHPATSADDAAAPLFRHSSDTMEPDTSDDDQPELAFAGTAGGKTGDKEPSPPSIPPTPDVPDADPTDDDVAHEAGAGIAARLALLQASYLAKHRDTLEDAANRLKALLDRAS